MNSSPLSRFRAALAANGLRTMPDYDELGYTSPDCTVRLNLRRVPQGQSIRCFLSVSEQQLLGSGLELFNEIALEGYPIVAYGAGRGQAAFEFEWLHPAGADWHISGQRVDLLLQRVRGALDSIPFRQKRSFAPEILEGVLAISAA